MYNLRLMIRFPMMEYSQDHKETREGFCPYCKINIIFIIVRWDQCSTLSAIDFWGKSSDDVHLIDNQTVEFPVLQCTGCGNRITGGEKKFTR